MFKHRNRIYDYVAIDRVNGKIVGRSNNYAALCKKWPEVRYEIKCRFALTRETHF